MNKTFILLIFLVWPVFSVTAQVSINNDGSAPDNSAMLDVKSSDKGVLIPRMNLAQRDAISSPAEGLLIFNITTMCFDYYFGGSWKSFCGVTEPTFQGGMTILDTRDGKMYNTVQIGMQCWMAENLNVGTMILSESSQSDNNIIEKYCYNNSEDGCDVYGGTYQWNEMMQYVTTEGTQGICPSGWHIPTHAEWSTLLNYLGGSSVAGGKMKEVGTVHWLTPNAGATNSSGFTALPGGYVEIGGIFQGVPGDADIWSSTIETTFTNIPWFLRLWYDAEDATFLLSNIEFANSVRCLKD